LQQTLAATAATYFLFLGLKKKTRDHICTSFLMFAVAAVALAMWLFPAWARWIEVHRTAHQLGIPSNCTMLYGHVERPEHKVDHLLRLRDLQDETGGFNAFIPLAYHPENNYLGLKYHTTGVEDLRHIATARLFLDNLRHIKAYWIMITPKLAQVALSFGADDIDGTVVEETIYHMAGADLPPAYERVGDALIDEPKAILAKSTFHGLLVYRNLEKTPRSYYVDVQLTLPDGDLARFRAPYRRVKHKIPESEER